MALQTASLTYSPACDRPDCLVPAAPVWMLLMNGVETTANEHFLAGVVTTVVASEEEDLVTVTLNYNDATLPVDFVFTFPSEGVAGTVCPPDCANECDWLSKVMALEAVAEDVETSVNPTTFQYRLFAPDDLPANGSWRQPRFPLQPGGTILSITVTHDVYDPDADTEYDLVVSFGSGIYVSQHIVASAGVQTTLLLTAVTFEDIPVVQITNFTYVTYLTAARGMVVTIQAVHP